MDLKRIENIIRIAEEKNITRAADKLFLSQPALNLQLLNLEKELGTKLFYRRGNEWSITEAGQLYVDTARRMLTLKKDCYSKISDIAKLHNEEIAIGAPGIQGDRMMTAIYGEFHKSFPHVKLQLNIMKGLKAQELVRNSTIDLAIILMGDKQIYHLQYDFLASIEVLLAISENNPLLSLLEKDDDGTEVMDLKNLRDVPFVLGAKDSTERYVSEQAFGHAGIDPTVYMEAEGLSYPMAMVAAGECCSLVGAYHRPELAKGTRLVKLKSHPVMNACAVRRKDSYLSEPMELLLKLSRGYWSQLSDTEN